MTNEAQNIIRLKSLGEHPMQKKVFYGVLPASSLFVIGVFIWIQRNADSELVDKS